MMRRLGCIFAIVAMVVMMVFAFVAIQGVVKVNDYSGQVIAARVSNVWGAYQPLHEIFDGTWVTIPRLEGSIEVRCRDGSERNMGYVTQHMSTSVEVPKGGNCADVRDPQS